MDNGCAWCSKACYGNSIKIGDKNEIFQIHFECLTELVKGLKVIMDNKDGVNNGKN